MEKIGELKKEIKIGEEGYINKNCWLASSLGYPPSARCRYCQSKFNNCLFFQYLIISIVLVLSLISLSFMMEGKISKLLIIAIFSLIIVYGYFFNKSTEKIVVSNFEEKKAKEGLQDLTENLQHKVKAQTEEIRKAYQTEKDSKDIINAIRVEDEALLASIGDGVIAVDKDGKIMFINRAAEEMLGVMAKDAINNPHTKILHVENEKGEVLSENENRLCQALRMCKKTITSSNSDSSSIYYYVRADKSRFPVAVTIAPVILDGKVNGAIDVFRDITIERQIDKSKGEFVSLASHQLRTPLSAIKWYSEALLEGKPGKLSVKQKKYLNEVYHGNERMIRLINVLLNVSRLEAGTVKANPVQIDVKKMVEDVIKEQKFDIKKKAQKFVFECENDLPKILGDQSLVGMVFQNLISNAIKYTLEAGKISCVISKNEGGVLFKLIDTGIGIPKDQQLRVFEKLFRAENAFSHDPEGNGLGLYLAKKIVEGMGGKIWFESKEGEGTTFFVSLPTVRD